MRLIIGAPTVSHAPASARTPFRSRGRPDSRRRHRSGAARSLSRHGLPSPLAQLRAQEPTPKRSESPGPNWDKSQFMHQRPLRVIAIACAAESSDVSFCKAQTLDHRTGKPGCMVVSLGSNDSC